MHREELAGAISRIARRRAAVDDVHRDRLPDAADSDPREVLRYLRQFSGTDIPRWVLQADVCDALILNNWLWWEDRRTELHFLLEGRRRGLFLDQLGAQVGVGKQGVRDRIDRLEALLRYDRPNEKLTRAARAAAKVADQRRTAEDTWIKNHQAMLRDAIAELLEQAGRLVADGEDREWLDELAVDTNAEGDLGRTIMPILGLAVDELRTSPAVLALPATRPPHPVHEALARCDALRGAFAAVTDKPVGRAQRRRSEAIGL